jgi:AcrR family transcriptional regulator
VPAPAETNARRPGAPARISQASVVDAAIEIGITELTMQKVAERLGVTVQALYRWVSDRDHLIDLVADRVAARVMPPLREDTTDWRDILEHLAHEMRREMLAVPGLAAHALVRYNQASSTFLALQERVFEGLLAGGMTPAQAVHAWAIFGNSVLAGIAREQSMETQRRSGRRFEEEMWLAQRRADISLPLVNEHGSIYLDTPPDERFDLLVRALLDGLGSLS